MALQGASHTAVDLFTTLPVETLHQIFKNAIEIGKVDDYPPPWEVTNPIVRNWKSIALVCLEFARTLDTLYTAKDVTEFKAEGVFPLTVSFDNVTALLATYAQYQR